MKVLEDDAMGACDGIQSYRSAGLEAQRCDHGGWMMAAADLQEKPLASIDADHEGAKKNSGEIFFRQSRRCDD